MKLSATVIFTIFLFFSIDVFAIRPSRGLRRALSQMARESIEKTNEKFIEGFRELEENLGIHGLPDLKPGEVLSLRRSNYNPFGLGYLLGHNVENRSWVFRAVVEDPTSNSILVLRWWEHKAFRDVAFDIIRKEHLTGRWDLLLKWWEETKLRGETERLVDFIASSFKAGESYNVYGHEVLNFMADDDFLQTVFRAVDENENFAEEADSIIRTALRRVYPEEGVDLEDLRIPEDGSEGPINRTVDPSFEDFQEFV